MRRKDREIVGPEKIIAILNKAKEIFIAMPTDNAPYVIPVNFVYYKDCIYFHSAYAGRKIKLLQNNQQVGFATAIDIAIDNITTRYRSVCGTAIASFIEDIIQKNEILQLIAERFNAPCIFPIPKDQMDKTLIICLNITEITGKMNIKE